MYVSFSNSDALATPKILNPARVRLRRSVFLRLCAARFAVQTVCGRGSSHSTWPDGRIAQSAGYGYV